MPVMGGVEMARRLAGSTPDLRIVFMSGYTESFSDVDELPGVRSFLIRKPIDSAELVSAVSRVLD